MLCMKDSVGTSIRDHRYPVVRELAGFQRQIPGGLAVTVLDFVGAMQESEDGKLARLVSFSYRCSRVRPVTCRLVVHRTRVWAPDLVRIGTSSVC
jgi:hypothetical protein